MSAGGRPSAAAHVAAGHGIATRLLVDLMLHRLPLAERRAIVKEALAELEFSHPRSLPATETARRSLVALLAVKRT
jgi:hypothetical protein